MKYAYDLNIDYQGIRSDILYLDSIYNDLDQSLLDKHGCQKYDDSVFYPSFSLVKYLGLDNITALHNMFNGSFISVFKIFQMQPREVYGFHIDNNKHRIYKDIPQHLTCPAALNVLLSKPVGDTTRFALDYDLNKYRSWDGKDLPRNDSEDFTVVDEFEIRERVSLLNIGTWHRIDSLNSLHPRKMASFTLWPYNTWQGYVEYCRSKGYLIER
jgi:hypothetical protein